jgi:hypothetical protein
MSNLKYIDEVGYNAKERYVFLNSTQENTRLYLPERYSEKDVQDVCESIKNSWYDYRYWYMYDICKIVKEAYIVTEIKPGQIFDTRGIEQGRDRWEDKMSWDEWVSDMQVAKEFYSRNQKYKEKKKTIFEKDD